MSMVANVGEFLLSIQKLSLSAIWRGHGSSFFIELGHLTPRRRRNGSPGNPVGEVTLGIEGSWRIENPRSVEWGSWTDEALWDANFEHLVNATIDQVELLGRLKEICVTLDSGHSLVSFSTTSGDPEWYFIDRRTDRVREYFAEGGKVCVRSDHQ